MCGITGIVGPMHERAAVVAAMTRAIAHRGPDGEGLWSDDGCALGHRRLSIIDLSANASQPMANEDGSIEVVFNGEIYGFGALRDELVAKGHTFRSQSDTEVVVHLYEEEGDRAFSRLNGMFAVAVWDARRRRLVLARDRFGQKPLFWAEVSGALVFASELKALFEVPGIALSPSLPAIDAFLTTHFVAAPATFFEGVHRLPAGHVLVKELGRAPVVAPFETRAVRRRAWVSFDDAVDEALELVKASVARQLVADVPVGLFLSGGIDSTLVLAALADLGRASIPAFTASFADSAKHDELPFARVAADRFGGSLREVPIDARAFLDLDRLVAMYDEPFADVAALPTHLLAKAARVEVTVALTGDGGDELFGGYTHHRVALWLGRLGAPTRGRRALFGAAATALAGHGARRGRLRSIARALELLAAHDLRAALARLRGDVRDGAREALYTPAMRASIEGADPFAGLLGRGELGVDDVFDVSRDAFLADHLLMKTDIAAMAASLECRSPFLDVPLAEFAASLPLDALARVDGKRVLRAALARRMGAGESSARGANAGLSRRRKTGFSPPLGEWMRGELAPLLRERLVARGARVHAFVEQGAVTRLVEDHVAGRADDKRLLWALLVLETWLAALPSMTTRGARGDGGARRGAHQRLSRSGRVSAGDDERDDDAADARRLAEDGRLRCSDGGSEQLAAFSCKRGAQTPRGHAVRMRSQ